MRNAQREMLNENDVWELDEEDERLIGADNSPIYSHGIAKMEICNNEKKYMAGVHILDQAIRPLLSKQGCVTLGLLSHGWPRTVIGALSLKGPNQEIVMPNVEDQHPKEIETQRQKLMEEFSDVFNEGPLRPMVGPPHVH